ncbi:MAG: molybdopterin-dependent oxidoreductase [Deltaproteobacteria bacterium]|nr:molybdopterin-dependent oxidoreductase [Deltaproteobacteria bacterium]
MPTPGDDAIHHRACNLCEAICGLLVEVKDGSVVSIKGDPDDPLSRGYLCPKAFALQDINEDPDRLRRPVRRTEDGWEEIGWDEALDEAARRLAEVQSAHGRDAVAVYQGNPSVHNAGSMLFSPPFVRTLRTKNRFSATSVDQLPHHVVGWAMFGHQMMIPIPDIDRTDFFLVMGANPLASNGSLMTAPGMGDRLKALSARGGRLVVVDPRRSETARRADTHHFIRPGTDALLLLALLHTVFAEELTDLGRLAPHLDAEVEEVTALVDGFAPTDVAGVVGISAEDIAQLARDFASAESAVCYPRMGLSTQAFGTLCNWLAVLLNLVTGNLDEVGGAMFTTPAFDTLPMGGRGHLGRFASRVSGAQEFGGELPVSVLAEEILTEGTGQIRALVTSAGNPVLSTPNGPRLDGALSGLDFMLAVDIYINESTRHADIILPPTTGLETAHYDLAFHPLAVRNTSRWSSPTLDAGPEARHDWQIFRELRARLLAHAPDPADRGTPTDAMDPHQLIDFGLASGPHGAASDREHPVSLQLLKEHPSGVDLGPLEPRLPGRLFTEDGLIHLVPAVIAADLPRARALLDGPSPDLVLIGRRSLRDNNSWMHNSPRLQSGRERCTALVHPSDAEARGIVHGQQIEVRSRVGAVRIEACVSDEVMPGVVSIPHGFGHGRPGARLRVAARRPGVSANDLTDERLVDAISGNAALNGVPVHVRSLGGAS